MNSTMSLFMSLVEGREAGRPSGGSTHGEQKGEKMCLGFREREREGVAGYRLQAAGSRKAFSLLGIRDGGNAERSHSFPMTKEVTAKRLSGRGSA